MEQKGESDFIPCGILEGHSDWVTSIVAGFPQVENEDSPVLVSGSRDKTLIVWKLYEEEQEGYYGIPFHSLTGHNHFVSDLALSLENCFVISSSWDKTLRLWDLRQGKTTKTFFGHQKEVFTVAFSPDNRQIISAGADKVVKLWNTLADCKHDSDSLNHNDWVSCIRYSPAQKQSTKQQQIPPYFASVGWDGRCKIWNTNIQVKYTFKVSENNLNSLSIAPNCKYVATGGKDRKLCIWDITDLNQPSREFDAGSTINQLCINPKMQWVACATENNIKIFDLTKPGSDPYETLVVEAPKKTEKAKTKYIQCTSLTWNALGKKLFAGFADGNIRVWSVQQQDKMDK